jgi:hypothetical protein
MNLKIRQNVYQKFFMTDLQVNRENQNSSDEINQMCTFEKKSKALSRLRILILIVFLFFGSMALFAQKSTCSFFFPVQSTFGYTEGLSGYSEIPNKIVAIIAEAAIKNPQRIFFYLNSQIKIRIVEPEGMNPMLRVFIGPQVISGDIHYRKFSMADVMIPDRVTLGCRIEKKDSSLILGLPETADLNLNNNDSSVLQCQIPHFSCDSDTIVLNHLHFCFDEEAFSRFKERVNLINDYYAANAIMDSLDKRITSFDIGAINNYPAFFILLEELNKILKIIKEKNFAQRLDLDSSDPEEFQIKYDRLSLFSVRGTATMLNNIKTYGELNSTFSQDSLITLFLDDICRYIRWSMLVTERNSLIYKEFLDSFFRLIAFVDDREVIRDLARYVYPANEIDSSLAMISAKISKAYLARADELMNNKQFIEADELLKNARDFNEINPYLKGNADYRDMITKASNGIYDSFLGVTDVAIQNGKLELAQTYMSRAQNYRKEHKEFVTSDSLFNKVLGELIAGSLSRCDTLFNTSQYFGAMECYQDLKKSIDSLTLSSIHSGLESKIQFCKFKMLIAEGENSLVKSDKPEAGRKFFLARQLSQDENFPPDSLLDSLCRATYPFYLIYLLYSGEVRIWTNHLDLARRLADSIAFIQRTTGEESSRELSEALAGYRRLIAKNTCWNAHEAVDVFLVRAQQERELKNFILASLLTDSAILIIDQNPDCLIPSDGIKDTIIKYEQAVDFQMMQQNIDSLFMKGQYEKAIYCYPVMESLFTSDSIRRFGVDCISMYDYVYERSNQDLTIQAYLYFRKKDNLQKAFLYLELLRLQDYPRKSARPFLEDLGKEYANGDFRDQPDTKPVLLLRSYCGKDDWMKEFRFAYYSQAQHLRHKPFFMYLFRMLFP